MKLTNSYGKDYFYQWDLNQRLVLSSDLKAVDQVHFENLEGSETYISLVENGSVAVPNEVLQRSDILKVWAYVDVEKRTTYSQQFKVIARQKPSDYVYDPTEILTLTEVLTKSRENAEKAEFNAGNAEISAKLAKSSEENAKTSEINAKTSEDSAKEDAERAKGYADAMGEGVLSDRIENALYAHGQGATQSKPVELKIGVEDGKNDASIGYIRTMGKNLLTFDPYYFEGEADRKTQSCRWVYICVEQKETYTIHFNQKMAIIRTEGRHSDGSRYTIHEENFTDTLTFTDSVRKTVDIYIQSNTFFVPSQIEAQMEFGPRFTEYHAPRCEVYRLNEPNQIKVKKGDYLYKNTDGFWYNGTAKLSEADNAVMESIEVPKGPFYLWCESHSHHYMQGLVTLEYTQSIHKALDEKADSKDVYTKLEVDAVNEEQNRRLDALETGENDSSINEILITKNAEGNPCTCTDSMDRRLRSLDIVGNTEGGVAGLPWQKDPIRNVILTGITVNDSEKLFSQNYELASMDILRNEHTEWGITRAMKKRILVGAEDEVWGYDSSLGKFYISIPNMLGMDIRCDSFSEGVSLSEKRLGHYVISDGRCYFTPPVEQVRDVFSLKAWLSVNPVTIQWPVTPTEYVFEPLAKEDQKILEDLHTFYPETIIRTNGGNIGVTYYADIALYIDHKIKEAINAR